MQKNLVKRVRLREQVPVIVAVISAEGTGGPVYPSDHRRLAEYSIRGKGRPDRLLTCTGYTPFDLLIGEQGGAHYAQES